MSHFIMRRGFNNRNNSGVDEYNEAIKMAKSGIEMVMDGMESDSKKKVAEGAEMAWEGMKKICDLSKEMEDQYGERSFNSRDAYQNREWNERDDEMMERRMRDSMGRYK